ncbi:hypothetical protein LOAG_14641 [Loa loa]|uniref:Uncharacterized protein n=1 Tax=Loa loa TaxID=7209 RepID=A0A1S0THF2_LOALO|nr:hypothetical protein LOAG_14641 [Loa loa]EFO13886.1 hypothetical protein LOAG_14641 [Loa loa]
MKCKKPLIIEGKKYYDTKDENSIINNDYCNIPKFILDSCIKISDNLKKEIKKDDDKGEKNKMSNDKKKGEKNAEEFNLKLFDEILKMIYINDSVIRLVKEKGKKSVGRRRGSSLRNGQAINVEPAPKRSLSPMQTAKDVKDEASTISTVGSILSTIDSNTG